MKQNYFKQIKIITAIMFVVFSSSLFSQKIITNSNELNQKIKSGSINVTELFGVTDGKDGVGISPNMEKGLEWFAVKNYNFDGTDLTFFFVNGRIYTDDNIRTDNRRIKLQKNVSPKVESNLFHIAFMSNKGKEQFINLFIYSDEKINAIIEIPESLLGIEKSLRYTLDAGEMKFITIQKLPEESAPFYFTQKSAKRDTICLNKNWKFKKGDVEVPSSTKLNTNDWEDVSIPHCYNSTDIYDTRNINDGLYIVTDYYRGITWYSRNFEIDKTPKGKKLSLEFEGVSLKAEVWLNGKYLGKHIGGYTGFKFDVTSVVGVENILTVKVDNSYDYTNLPHSADYNIYGGIYRDVRIITNAPLYIEDNLKVTTKNISDNNWSVSVKGKIINAMHDVKNIKVVSNIVNKDNEIISTEIFQQNISLELDIDFTHTNIKNPKLWSPSNPALYKHVTTLYADGEAIDNIGTPLGFRWFKFDSETGLTLNGKQLFLKGVNKHQDYFMKGIAVPDSLQVEDIKIIKNMGANFIRLAHYPQDPSVLKACDELGLIVWEEIPIVNSVGGKEYFDNAKNMMREMVNRDFNHPSIFMWGLTNESVMGFANDKATEEAYKLVDELNVLAKELDPSRVTTQAHNHFRDPEIGNLSDLIGRNRYYGWYTMPITLFKDELEREKKEHTEWIFLISEYGVGSKRGYHVENPERFDFSEEYQNIYHEYYWKTIKETPWIAGSLIWAMFDFASPTKYGNIPKINQKGTVDFNRRPKDLYYFYQSQWTDKPMVYVVSHTLRKRTGAKEESKLLKVYSNCDEVELFINGDSQGSKENEYVYEWNVEFAEGENIIKAVGKKGDKTIIDSIDIIYQVVGD